MLKKKFFAKALAFAMVAGLTAAAGPAGMASQPVKVFAEGETTGPEIEIDYTNYTATITKEGAKYLFLEVLKDSNGSKVSATHGYKAESGSVTVDLSFLKATKDQYLRAYSDNSVDDKGEYVRGEIVKVTAQPAKFSIKYDAIDGLVDGKSKAKLTFAQNGTAIYQYKTLYGTAWAGLEEDTIENMHMDIAGTTLMVRKAAVPTAGDVAGTPASAEIKVKIAAIPKAPKVTIDYVKGLVKLGKNTEYTTLDKLVTETPDWKTTSDNEAKGIEITKLLQSFGGSTESTSPNPEEPGEVSLSARTGDDSSITLAVRTKKDKKAASAVTFVTLKAPETITETPATDGNGGTWATADNSKKLTYANTTKGLSLKAEGGAFEYYDKNKGAWKTIAAGKTIEIKMTSTDTLKVRAAGVKATKDKAGSLFSEEQELSCTPLPAKLTVTVNKDTIKADDAGATATVTAVDGNNNSVDLTGKTISWKATGGTSTPEEGTNKTVITASAAGKVTVTATVEKVTSDPVEITVEAAAADSTEQ